MPRKPTTTDSNRKRLRDLTAKQAAVHAEDYVHFEQDAQIVRGEDHAIAVRVSQLDQDVDDVLAVFFDQVAGGFVRQEQWVGRIRLLIAPILIPSQGRPAPAL